MSSLSYEPLAPFHWGGVIQTYFRHYLKSRGTVSVPHQATEAEIRRLAESQPAIAKFLVGKHITKLIYVPMRTMNFVGDA